MSDAPVNARMPRSALVWLWLSFLIVVADQASKWWIITEFELYESLPLLPVLDITRLHNTGAAFSFLADADGWQRWFFIGLGVVVSVLVSVWLSRIPASGRKWLAAGLALIVGGAVGNVIDRILFGHVVDFISVHYQGWYFPAFNVADSAITVGAGILLIESFMAHDGEIPGKKHEPVER